MVKYKRSRVDFSDLPYQITWHNWGYWGNLELLEIKDDSGKIIACIFTKFELNTWFYHSTPKLKDIDELTLLCQDYDQQVMRRHSSKVDHKLLAAAGRLSFPLGLSQSAKVYYTNYLKRYRKRAIDLWFENDFSDLFYKIPESILSRFTIDHALEKVYQTQNTELQAFLLNYKWKVLKIDQISSYSLTLQPVESNSYREIQREWYLADVDQPEFSLAGYHGPKTDLLTFPRNAGGKPITRVAKYFKFSSVEEIIIPEVYKSIDAYAFFVKDQGRRWYKCFETDLKKVTLPHSLHEIGEYAFMNCHRLEKIHLHGEISVIKEGTFDNCSSLNKIKLPETIKIIGNRAFFYCTSLQSVNLPKSLKMIGAEAFSHTGIGNSIDIPNTVRTIGKKAFSNCRNLKSIGLPGHIKMIRDGTFSNCASLIYFEIPDHVRVIGKDSFKNCTNLIDITFGENVEVIESSAFAYCTALQAITIPDNVRIIGKDTFKYCTNLTDINLGKNIEVIQSGAFDHCTSLQSIKIPDNVRLIGEEAFKDCASLTDITLGINLEVIESGAFADCHHLSALNLPASVKMIGQDAFMGIKQLTIDPQNPTFYVEANTLYHRESHEMVFYPPDRPGFQKKRLVKRQPKPVEYDSQKAWIVTELDSDTRKLGGFRGKKTATLNLPEQVDGKPITNIGKFKCTYSEKIETLIIPEGYEIIDYYAFAYLKFKSVILPNSLVDLGREAFKQCRYLEDITLGEELEVLKPETFLGCKTLKRISIPNGVKIIGKSAFEGCKQLVEVDLGEGVEVIEDKAFANCLNLKKIKLSASLRDISPTAFINSGLEGIDLINLPADTLYE